MVFRSITAESSLLLSLRRQATVDLGNGVKLEMVLIPAGEFMMGSPKELIEEELKAHGDDQWYKGRLPGEGPQHRVRITKPFYLGKYLVRQEQWEAVMGSNLSNFWGPTNPVEWVSWDDCQQFLKRLNDKVGGGKFQLPTEAQWEYACRAGSKTRYCFGDDEARLGDYAWYDKNFGNMWHPVGEKKPNGWGLYDMHGNVWEWCQDWWKDGYYKESPVDDPSGPTGGSNHVIRGGSCPYTAGDCRSACRNYNAPGNRYSDLGLRVSRVPAEGVAETSLSSASDQSAKTSVAKPADEVSSAKNKPGMPR